MNTLYNFKQWFTPYEKKHQVKTVVRLYTVILTKLKLQSMNYLSITTRASNRLRDNVIRIGAVYVCNDAHDEILGTIFEIKNKVIMN